MLTNNLFHDVMCIVHIVLTKNNIETNTFYVWRTKPVSVRKLKTCSYTMNNFSEKNKNRSYLTTQESQYSSKVPTRILHWSRCARPSVRHGRFVLITRPVYKYDTLENMTGARRLKYYKYVLTKFLIFVYRVYVRVNNMLILMCVFNGSRNRIDVSHIIMMC